MEGVSWWLDQDFLGGSQAPEELEFQLEFGWDHFLPFPWRSWGLEQRSIGNIHREYPLGMWDELGIGSGLGFDGFG